MSLLFARSCNLILQDAETLLTPLHEHVNDTTEMITTQNTGVPAADFFVVPTATCRLLFVRFIIAHDRRRVRHVAVTAHPTAAWTAQQLGDVSM